MHFAIIDCLEKPVKGQDNKIKNTENSRKNVAPCGQ